MKTYGYGSYRGRSKLRIFLTVLIIFLALILLLAVAGLSFLRPYFVQTPDGIRVELPFLKGEETPPPSPTASMELVVVTPSPSPTSAPAPTTLTAVYLPASAFSDGTVVPPEANTVLFDMKADSGDLGYASTLPLAAAANTSSTVEGINETIQAYNKAETYAIARVSCFKDHKTARADESLPIRTNSGYRWTDPQDLRWTSPASETARAYLLGVCKELAELGFDEILLDNACYPTSGNLGYIRPGVAYDVETRDDFVGDFYQEVRAVLDEAGVSLTIVASEDAVAGTDTRSGQTPENLAESAQRVFTNLPTGGTVQTITPYPAEAPLKDLVYFWDALPLTKGN